MRCAYVLGTLTTDTHRNGNIVHLDVQELSSHLIQAMTLGVHLREAIVADVLGEDLRADDPEGI